MPQTRAPIGTALHTCGCTSTRRGRRCYSQGPLASHTIRRAAFFIASLSVALAILGTARVVGVLRHNRASDAEIVRLFAWAIVPLSAAVAGMAAMLGESVAPVWWCAGALSGFVVLGAWSVGPSYGAAALALLVAAVVHLATIRPRWQTLLAPLWLLTGASSLAAVILILDWSRQGPSHSISEAPAVIFGGWVFAACAGILTATYGTQRFLRRRARRLIFWRSS